MSRSRPLQRVLAALLAVLLFPALPAGAALESEITLPGAEAVPDSVDEADDTAGESDAGGSASTASAYTLGSSGEQAVDGAAHTPEPFSGQALDGVALLELMERDPGGTITLDSDITLDDGADYLYLTRPVTVDAGPYTVTVDMHLSITGPITFTGTGTVVRVAGNGHLGTGSKGRIAARGDDSIALYLEQGGTYGLSTPISANGSGATAIYAQGHREFDGAMVTATGAGSVGIHTTGSAYLILSFVQGEGEAVLSDTGEITLEGGGARPMPEGATAIPLHGSHALSEQGWFLPAGTPPDAVELWGETLGLRFSAENGAIYGHSYPVSWDASGVDYHAPGDYPITGELRLPFATGLMTWDPLEFIVTVLQSDQAQITHATLVGEDLLLLHLLEEIRGAWWIRVWCSADGGDSWRDLDEEGLVSEKPGGILQIGGLTDGVTYQFYLEVWGGPLQGTSNTLEFYADPHDRQGGGEREGDGDGEDNPLPTVTEPPALPDTESGGGARHNGGTFTGQDADTDLGQSPEQIETTPQADPNGTEAAAPEPEHERVAAAAPVHEEAQGPEAPSYPDGAAVWSADRLALLAVNYPRQITFHAGGLSADLPTAALLEAVDGKDFAILLEQPSDDALRVRFYTGGGELEGLNGEPFRVALSSPGADRALRCVGTSGEQAALEQDGGKVVVTLTRTGDYALEPVDGEPSVRRLAAQAAVRPAEPEIAADEGTPILLWIILPAALIFAAGLLLCAKRRRGSG